MSNDNDNEDNQRPLDSESSSDEEGKSGEKEREVTVLLLRNHKNLAEPKTSQGAFGPNGLLYVSFRLRDSNDNIIGELISFFRAPPRIVRNVLRQTAAVANLDEDEEPSPVVPEPLTPPTPPPPEEQQTPSALPHHPLPSYFQSPALVSDAVRRLGLAATDRDVRPIDPAQPEAGLDILRAMTNLFTVPQQKRHDSESKQPSSVARKHLAIMQARRSMIFVTSTANIGGADKTLVNDYIFSAASLVDVCEANAEAARRHGRYDHERIFKTLRTLFKEPGKESGKDGEGSFTSDLLAKQMITLL